MSELHYQVDLLKAMNQKLSGRERMYRLVCDNTANAFLYCSFERNEIATLGKWKDFFSFEVSDIRDMAHLFEEVDDPYVVPLREALFAEKSGKESAVVECMRRDRKQWLKFQVRIVYDESGQPTDKIISIEDITKFKSQNDELAYMAYYDELTGLYNRNYFVRELAGLIRKAAETNAAVSVMIIDIDDFKKVNDGLGIVVGDELIQQFGSFLKELTDHDVIASHFTSDLYCIAIYDPVGTKSVEHIHRQIRTRTREAFRLSSGHALQITVSIGVAEYPEAASSALELINCAEIVMFKGKNMGKNTIQYFDTPILNEFIHNIEIENKLKEAVFYNNFLLYYQPQFYAGNKKLRGVEALIRWKDGNNGMISPSVFIPIAEKNGAIIPIGSWVVERSIEQYARWSRQYGKHFILSINISALQCGKEDFVDSILGMIKKYDVQPSEIELEITESILIDDFEAVSSKLKLLRKHGIRISLDDFGTGFSSLSYLKKLPIDTLKIDKSFIDTVLTDSPTRIITESIINMVKTLGFESVAEGVEAEQQYRYLHAVGCDVIQGYLLGKPQTAEDIERLLQEA
ncbi:MAG: GGDEF domain-containing protein [Lachnospiraceae bacterium]|nr:GGDEF domain-containing protein [Lachnospiraceae bacterium]